MLIVIGRVRCNPEHREELVAAFEEMQEASRREEGCLRYGFFAAVEDPLSFVAVEEWADREALDAHFAQPHLHQFARRLLELVSDAPEVAIHEIAETKPVPRGGTASELATQAGSGACRTGAEAGGSRSITDWEENPCAESGVT